MTSSEVFGIIYPLTAIVILGSLTYFFILVAYEVPEWVRSFRLYSLAKKYSIQFIRAKKGWRSGWLSLRAGEKNFISGSIRGKKIDFSDANLIEGSRMLGELPSVSIQGSKWDLNASGGYVLSQQISRLNGRFYYRLELKQLLSLFEKVLVGEIVTEEDFHEQLKNKDFSKHIVKNYELARYISFSAFVVLFLLMSFIPWDFLRVYEGWFFVGIILICIFIFLYTSQRFGKIFTPQDIYKYPGQDETEERIELAKRDSKS